MIGFDFNRYSLLGSQLRQIEEYKRIMRDTAIECAGTSLLLNQSIQDFVKSPIAEWIQQKEDLAEAFGTSINNFVGLAASWDNDKLIRIMGESFGYQGFGFEQWNELCRTISELPYDKYDYNRMFGIASQISPVLKDLDFTGLTSNLERIQAQLSHWDSSLEETDYDDISVNDDGSLCYQEQCVTQPEINDIWNTFVQNCENLGSKAIEAIKDKAWVVQWIYRFICIITTLGLYREIEEHIHKGILEVRSHANGWDKMFYIKKDNGARVYSAPDTKSEILGRLDYEQVIISTDIQPFWIKFEYQVAEGQTTEAWIATCNLIRYDKLQNNHLALLEDEK
ncbi:SH3 domain-containing protein [Enterocloster bolteae]|nr:SH3 domain-containing protein [Enterocloster bolteae]MDU3286789.1 SH3 domain-containing protein [Enterocloster bolteae]